MSIADGKVDILINVDTKDAKKELEDFIKEYSNKKHKIEISVGIDPQIHNKFKKIVQEFANSTVNINLGLDVSKAREQLNDFIKNFKFENIQFGVNFDKNSIQNNIKEASNFVDSAFKNNKPVKINITLDEYAMREEAKRVKTYTKHLINETFEPNISEKIDEELKEYYRYIYEAEQKKAQIDNIAKQRAKEQINLENQKAKATVDSAKIQNSAHSRIADGISYINNRIFNLLRNAFVFNVISRGFRAMAQWTGILINKDQQLFNSLTLIKANLINAFQPIIQVILPWIRLLGEGLVWLSQLAVDFVNFFTGGNAKVISSFKEAKSTVQDFEDLLKEKTKVKIPALPNSGFVEPISVPLKTYIPKKIKSSVLKPINWQSLALEKPKKNNLLDNIRNNIDKIANKAPKLKKSLLGLKRDLASFDKIEVLKLKKQPLDIIIDSFKDTYKSAKKIKDYLPKIGDTLTPKSKYSDFVRGLKDTFKLPKYKENDFIDGLKSTFKSPKSNKFKSIFDKDRNYGEMELPKLNFEINPQSSLNVESFKKWLKNNAGLINILKTMIYSFLFNKFTPLGIFGSAIAGTMTNLFIETAKAVVEGAKKAKKLLEEHPDWVGIHIDEKGHPNFGVLPGEKPEDYSTPHDTQLAEILAMEERSKQIKLGKEKEFLQERANLTKENFEELNKIHEEQREVQRKKDIKYIEETDKMHEKQNKKILYYHQKAVEEWNRIRDNQLAKASSILKLFNDTNINAFDNYYNHIKRLSGETVDKIGEDKKKDTSKLSDELAKQRIFVDAFCSHIKSETESSFKQISRNLMNMVSVMVSNVLLMFENVKNKISEIADIDYFDKKSIRTTETGIEIKNWYPQKLVDFLEDLDKQRKYNIPHLAQGALLRGGDPFLAYVGDQPRGQTNIEAPLSTIVDAFKTALSEIGAPTNNINISATGDMSQMIRFLNLKISEENRRTGTSMVSLIGGE